VWSDTANKYTHARIIFLDVEKSNWEYDPDVQQYYWHRFFKSQPNLNFENPDVQEEIIAIMRFWMSKVCVPFGFSSNSDHGVQGIDGFRVDAVPYLYQREGTNCENLPETHAFLKRLRSVVDEEFPGLVEGFVMVMVPIYFGRRILLAEANQWPDQLLESGSSITRSLVTCTRRYFGTESAPEFHMAFHFPVMPRIFISLRKENVSSLVWVFNHTPPIPPSCQWCMSVG